MGTKCPPRARSVGLLLCTVTVHELVRWTSTALTTVLMRHKKYESV